MDENNSGYFNLHLPESKPPPKKEGCGTPIVVKIILGILIGGAAIIVLPIVFCLFVVFIGHF